MNESSVHSALFNLFTQRDPGRIGAHAFLFLGARSTGKEALIRQIVRSWICDPQPSASLFASSETQQNKPCGSCVGCRQYEHGTHPDVISIVREEEKHLISIEQMRDMLKDVYRSPSLGTKKFVLLEDAHELSVGAANAFLKTLEEPPASAVFFLTSHRPSKLLPTIISRCQVIELVQQAADSDNEERETEKQLFSDFLSLSAGDRINIIAEHFKKKTPHAQASIVWDRRLIYWQEFLRDQLIEQAGQKNKMLNQKLVQSIDLLEEIRRDLGFHVNLRARLEHFAISL